MSKWRAIQHFWESFNIPAYDAQSVPKDAELPYITYEAQTGSLDGVLSLTSSIWYRGSSWTDVCNKADEIDAYLNNGITIPLDDGQYLWIVKGSPFAQRLADETDKQVKRIIINIQAEYLAR